MVMLEDRSQLTSRLDVNLEEAYTDVKKESGEFRKVKSIDTSLYTYSMASHVSIIAAKQMMLHAE